MPYDYRRRPTPILNTNDIKKHHFSIYDIIVCIILMGASMPSSGLSMEVFNYGQNHIFNAFDWRFVASLAHGVFLVCGYLVISKLIYAISPWLKNIFCFSIITLTLSKILVLVITGFHMNGYVLSALKQLEWSEWQNAILKISPLYSLFIAGMLTAGLGLVFHPVYAFFRKKMSKKPKYKFFDKPAYRPLSGKKIIILTAIGFSGLLIQHSLAGWYFFMGDPKSTSYRREQVYNFFPHPYHIRSVFEIFFTPKTNNPFALTLDRNPALPVSVPADEKNHFAADALPNVVMIVVDSLRAFDLRQNPELMPHLTRQPDLALDLYHNAISNCTHFGFFTLFTGLYPHDFSGARRVGRTNTILNRFKASGYDLSAFTANSLDWYDTEKLILPEDTSIWTAPTATLKERDQLTADAAINSLLNMPRRKPFFVLTYLYGTHWPYSAEKSDNTTGSFDRYKRSMGLVDGHIGHIIDSLASASYERDTLLLITSDHGDEGGNNSDIGHGAHLTPFQTEIPFAALRIKANNEDKSSPDFYPLPQSHLNVADWLTAIIEQKTFTVPDQALLMEGCAYDYPQEFSLVLPEGRVNFALDNGYLLPLPSLEGESPDPSLIQKALPLIVQKLGYTKRNR